MLTDHVLPTTAGVADAVAAPPYDEPVDRTSTEDEETFLGVTELLLKDPDRVDRLAREERRQFLLIPCFLAIGLVSFSLFALALTLTFSAAATEALPELLAERWAAYRTASAVALWLAYALGFVLATGVCLPSFYFYGLLAGVRVTWLQVTAQIMKGQAATAMMLMGVLPVYLATALGVVVFGAEPDAVRFVLWVGLALPFAAGLWGVRSMHLGFLGLADTLPPERRCQRECWLRRLTFACSVCYTAVCPVMIYTLWLHFADQLAHAGL